MQQDNNFRMQLMQQEIEYLNEKLRNDFIRTNGRDLNGMQPPVNKVSANDVFSSNIQHSLIHNSSNIQQYQPKNERIVFNHIKYSGLRNILLYAIRKECYSDWGSDNGCPHCRYSNNEKVKELCAHFYKKNNSMSHINHLRDMFDDSISNTYFKNIFKEHTIQNIIQPYNYYLDEKAKDVIFSILLKYSIAYKKTLKEKYDYRNKYLVINEHKRLKELAETIVDNLELAILLKELNIKNFKEYMINNTEKIHCPNEHSIKKIFLSKNTTYNDILMLKANNVTLDEFFVHVDEVTENIDDLYTRYSLLNDALTLDKRID